MVQRGPLPAGLLFLKSTPGMLPTRYRTAGRLGWILGIIACHHSRPTASQRGYHATGPLSFHNVVLSSKESILTFWHVV